MKQIGLFDYSAKMGLRREYPADSLSVVDGCDYDDCFSCAGIDCSIRADDRHCIYAPLGKPYPCSILKNIATVRVQVDRRCEFIDQTLAHQRAGDHQPSPCCDHCELECESRCEKGEKR